MTITKQSLAVQPLSGYTGAEILGVDLSQPLDPETVAEIRAAFLQWKVIFFRDQQLDHGAQIRFGRYFGEVTPAHPYEGETAPLEFPEIHTVSPAAYNQRYGENYRQRESNPNGPGWHADVTPLINPPAASILRAEVVPPFGGDTQFTNVAKAYEGLSRPIRNLIDGLRAEHRFGHSYVSRRHGEPIENLLETKPLAAIHPVVRIHPETAEPVIYVNPSFTKHIVDLSPRESRHLLDLLFEQVARPEYTVRFKWEPGSLAFWDNRAALHLAPKDFEHLGHDRILHRITLVGDVPVGRDGRRSELLEGEPFLAADAANRTILPPDPSKGPAMTLLTDIKIDVRPQSGWTGAEISGVDLTQPLDPEVAEQIREVLLKWKVVFFRDQLLNHAQHVQFARAFGKPTPAHPLFDAIPDPDYPEVYPVFRGRFQGRRNGARDTDSGWHTDVTAAVNPPAASILRSNEVVPPYGGDTQFANTVAAYEDLSDSFRSYVDTLRARHQFTLGADATEDYKRRWNSRPLLSEHPVVRVHPETGERSIFVNPGFTKEIVGVTGRESRKILELLYEQISRPRYTVRFKWEPGSIAFWDNRETIHMGPTDIDHLDFVRDFFRVTIEGDVPVGTDGKASTAVEGNPFLAAVATAE